jgi:hypothetical protein
MLQKMANQLFIAVNEISSTKQKKLVSYSDQENGNPRKY